MEIDAAGDLILRVGTHEIREPKLVAWQTVKGRHRFIDVNYRKEVGARVRFDAAPHDAAIPLVIDPVLVFDNTFGGTEGSSATVTRPVPVPSRSAWS
jgi:hypothetical protein